MLIKPEDQLCLFFVLADGVGFRKKKNLVNALCFFFFRFFFLFFSIFFFCAGQLILMLTCFFCWHLHKILNSSWWSFHPDDIFPLFLKQQFLFYFHYFGMVVIFYIFICERVFIWKKKIIRLGFLIS